MDGPYKFHNTKSKKNSTNRKIIEQYKKNDITRAQCENDDTLL